MRFIFFLTFFIFSTVAGAGGCPPWLMCGKRGNLIISDPSYSAQVAAAQAGMPPSSFTSPFVLSSRNQSFDQDKKTNNPEAQTQDAPISAALESGNLVTPDSRYSARMSAAAVGVPTVSSEAPFDLNCCNQILDNNAAVANSNLLVRSPSVSPVRLLKNGSGGFRHQYLPRHPKPSFWGYDWGYFEN